ncbi:RDD [Shewanella piezotolerans WP3]|uniref:RDD n=1 Tax=Shewanella piezotolerans (strain WP3 / JCM 13877) TaxID=225849 RepID=B8CN85_SHEPW|nr:RDD family protein [Shewanella piezotolerans]ACJ28719.1 RDD [Shewanella piezotolerans WP3]
MRKQQTESTLDPKSLVTPYAFEIAPNVLYQPLASPFKRALAITVDGLLVAALAENAGWIFVLMVALTVVVHKRSKSLGSIVKWALYAFMLAGMVYALLGNDWNTKDNISGTSQVESQLSADKAEPETLQTIAELANYLPEVISASSCQDYSCAQKRLVSLKSALDHSSLSSAEQTRMLEELIDELPLTVKQKNNLKIEYAAAETALGDERIEQIVEEEADADADAVSNNPSCTNKVDWEELQDDSRFETEANSQSSPLAWLIGFLNDMGLGFGWAAFYFTVFTAWFDGQTLGKKLFGISVIQLDGSKITLWAAFGRYGGYAAGFTTGLLGFLQIFWDANRQAIQDKISATVVIDLRKPEIEAPKLQLNMNALNASIDAKIEEK